MSKNHVDLSRELRKDKVGMAFGSFGYNLGAAGLTTYITLFYTDYMLIPAATVAVIMLSVRVVDALTDVLLGFLIDRTSSKHGKVRPWLLWMALPAVISVFALYYTPNFSVTGRAVYAFTTYVFMEFSYLTCMALPLQALCSVITDDSAQRTKLSQIYGLFNTFAAIFINLFAARIMGLFGGGARGFFWYFGTVALIGVILMLVCFALTTERTQQIEQKKMPVLTGFKVLAQNRYWWILTAIQMCASFTPAMLGASPYYCKYWLNNQITAGALMSLTWGGIAFGIFAFMPVTRKIGKSKTAAIGFIFQVIGPALLLFAPSSVAVAWVSTFFRALGAGAYSGVFMAMRADVVEYGEWKTGMRTEGLIYSGASFGAKVGNGVGGAVLAAFLSWGNYIPNAATQAPQTMTAIKIAFLVMPILFTALSIVFLIFFDLEKRIPRIQEDLNERGKAGRSPGI